MDLNPLKVEQIKHALLKPPSTRSYDDLLLLKYHLTKSEFIQKTLAGIANPRQMNDLCRGLGLEEYESGQSVFSQGDSGDKVYVLLEGGCEVRVKYNIDLTQGQSEIRDKIIVTYEKSGQFFGERALQFDEPRSAGVICIKATSLITITKQNYLQVLSETRMDIPLGLKLEQYGTKEGVVKILSKVREKRSNQELDAVAAYLYRRVPFFQKFTMQHVVELCRVAETVTVWGRSVLFKQGGVGQAFYVILNGTVEVWANDSMGGDKGQRFKGGGNDVTDGLGSRVNQLVTGDCFGERALENDDSLRMASIVTGEDTTELLILPREDYNSLVFLAMQGDSAHKLKLLRKTELFRTLDGVHVQALSKFMEPRKYQIDEMLVCAGKRATEMIIIETGESKAVTEVTEGYEKMTDEEKHSMAFHRLMEPSKARQQATIEIKKKLALKSNKPPERDVLATSVKELKQKQSSLESLSLSPTQSLDEQDRAVPPSQMSPEGLVIPTRRKLERMATQHLTVTKKKAIDLGRIAPNSVLASYIALLSDVHEDVYHPETVIASTIVTAYTVNKHDLITHLAKDSFLAIAKMIQDHKRPVLNFLWENMPRMLDEGQWRMEKTWEKFRTQVTTDPHKNVNILSTLKQLNRMHLSQTSGNDHLMRIVTTEDKEETVKPRAHVDKDWGLPGSQSMISERKLSHSPKGMSSGSLRSSSWLSEPSLQVSTLIRQRLNESQATTEALELSTATSMRRGSLDLSGLALDGRPKTPQSPNRDGLSNSLRPSSKAEGSNHMPFSLIQIHREMSRSNPVGIVEQGRRNVRSYFRLCGSYATCAKAKELADTQMEQIYLTLFGSDPLKEKELLLNWTPFRGFEGIPVHFSDLLIIYCRSAPLEFAVVTPSKNIFNMNFPALCKPHNQRYAVIVANRLKDSSAQEDVKEAEEDSDEEEDFRHVGGKPSLLRRQSTSGMEEGSGVLSRRTSMKGSVMQTPTAGTPLTLSAPNSLAPNSKTHRRAMVQGTPSMLQEPSGLFDNSAFESVPQQTPGTGYNSRVLSNSSMNVPVPPSKMKAWPLYLLECSVLYEVLLTCPSRLDSLKYAMRRFGAMTDENEKALVESPKANSRRKGKHNVFEAESQATGRIDTGFTQKIHLKAFNAKQPDRVLKVVLQEGKGICVVPLYKWVLINAETFDTLNFTRAFSESNVRKLFYAEDFQETMRIRNPDDFIEEDDVLSVSSQPHNISNYRNLNEEFKEKHRDPTLVKSFSEAGFLPSYHPSKAGGQGGSRVLHESKSAISLPRRGSQGLDDDEITMASETSNLLVNNLASKGLYTEDQVVHAESLKLFERDITSKEISKQVGAIAPSPMWINNSHPLYESMDLPEEQPHISDPAEPQQPAATNTQGSIERKLNVLSESIRARSHVLQEHDTLYDQEHETHISRQVRTKFLHPDHVDELDDVRIPGRPKKIIPGTHNKKPEMRGRTKEQEMGLIRRRLEVIESLQTMGHTSLLGENKTPFGRIDHAAKKKVTGLGDDDNFKSVQSQIYASTRSGTPVENGSPTAPGRHMSPHKRQLVLAASTGPAGSAGRKLSESLRVLSESLDQQYPQMCNVLAGKPQ